MIEADIKKIEDWQIKHEMDNSYHFGEIRDMMNGVANKKDIENAVGKVVQDTVNGKLDKIKEHLNNQDTVLKELADKVQPLDVGRKWFFQLGKGIVYLGILFGALVGIIKFFETIK